MNEQYRDAAAVAYEGAREAAQAECRDRKISETRWPMLYCRGIALDIAFHELGRSGPSYNRLEGLIGKELTRLFVLGADAAHAANRS